MMLSKGDVVTPIDSIVEISQLRRDVLSSLNSKTFNTNQKSFQIKRFLSENQAEQNRLQSWLDRALQDGTQELWW